MKLSQTALKLSNTHTTFMHKPSTPRFSANLCRLHTYFSHLFRSYLFLSCLRILAFRHSLWFITIVPDTRRPLPKLCSFECCMPTVLSERKTDMVPPLPVYLVLQLRHTLTQNSFCTFSVQTCNSKHFISNSVSLHSNKLPYSNKAPDLIVSHMSD